MTFAGTVMTVGHSTLDAEAFVELLVVHGVRTLVDVRRFPGSRRHPQFGRDALADSVRAQGITYRHEPSLGGRRSPLPGSPNEGLRNPQFRGYADHMATEEFSSALARLEGDDAPSVMCAEAVPWRCHRWLLADALLVRGVRVEHILGSGARRPHDLSRAAVVEGGRLRYPGEAKLPFGEPTA